MSGAWPPRPEGWRHDATGPPDAFAVPWSWQDGLALVVWSFIANVYVGLAVTQLGLDLESGIGLLGATVLVIAVVIGGCYAWLRLRGVATWHLLGPIRPRWYHWLVGLGVGAAGWLFVTLVVALLVTVLGIETVPRQQSLEVVRSGDVVVVLLAVAVAVVLAPIAEELIYRSVLFQALRARAGLFPAMAMTSFVWAGLHVELYLAPSGFEPSGLVSVFGLVLLGLLFAGAMHLSGTIVVPLVAHAVFNSIGIALTALLG